MRLFLLMLSATQGVIETVSEVINENAPNPSMKICDGLLRTGEKMMFW